MCIPDCYPSLCDTTCSWQLSRQRDRIILNDRYRYIDTNIPLPGLISTLKKSENKTHDIGWILMRWRTFNRSIVRLSGFSCDPIRLSYNTRVHFTIVAYRRKIYRNIQCVLIAQQSLLIMSKLKCAIIFSNSLQTRPFIYLFWVARIFYRFCSCTNYKRGH